MVAADNPAGRLYRLVETAMELDRPDKSSPLVVLSDASRILHGHDIDTFDAIYKINELVREARGRIQELAVNQELYLKPIVSIESALTLEVLTQEDWSRYKRRLDEATMLGLQFCSDFLSGTGGELILEPDSLAQLQAEIESLSEWVMQGGFDAEFQAFLIRSLDEIRRAILAYRVGGADSLRRGLESALGAALRHGDQLNAKKDNKVVLKFFGILRTLHELVITAQRTSQLAEPIVKYFLSEGRGS